MTSQESRDFLDEKGIFVSCLLTILRELACDKLHHPMPDKTKKKIAKKKTAPKKRRPFLVVIDQWSEIQKHAANLAGVLTHCCEQEHREITLMLLHLYTCGYGHGLLTGVYKAKNPRGRKVPYSDPIHQPQNRMADLVVNFFQRYHLVHPPKTNSTPMQKN